MSVNYFAIMEAADKEMVHSAMLRFLLHNAPPVLALFPPFTKHPGALRISLEEVCKSGKNKRERFDVVARSGGQTLIVENKLKSFPTLDQLARYDAALRGARRFPGQVKYLLCFDAQALSGGSSQVCSASGEEPWGIVTYAEIREALLAWLALPGLDLHDETRAFCRHYANYLGEYYATFKAVKEDCRLAFCGKKEREKARADKELKPLLSAREAALAASDPNFWQTLILHLAGLQLEKLLTEKLWNPARLASAQGRLIVHSKGASATPNMDVQPPDWPGGGGESKPIVCIQVQDGKLKLYVKDLNESAKGKRAAALAYAHKLREVLGGDGGVAEGRMKSHAKRSNSFSVYRDDLTLLGGGTAGVREFAERIWSFYERMDKVVKRAGEFED